MGHIKEPPGVTFTVDPKPLTKEEKKKNKRNHRLF